MRVACYTNQNTSMTPSSLISWSYSTRITRRYRSPSSGKEYVMTTSYIATSVKMPNKATPSIWVKFCSVKSYLASHGCFLATFSCDHILISIRLLNTSKYLGRPKLSDSSKSSEQWNKGTVERLTIASCPLVIIFKIPAVRKEIWLKNRWSRWLV